ncbi:excalibur calcium-binding domain-containing protein [Micrococcus sp. NPDC078436]|uniref:excalibur calcium-binding domain-containing protein n=1 Tax=Micrococcus sp. NPDC078436 TaxID=3154960 RepID=UPI00344E960D
MKKLATGVTLTAALGVSLFAAAPATAAPSYANCQEVYAANLSHITPDTPGFRKGLDGDGDKVACVNPPKGSSTHKWTPATKPSAKPVPAPTASHDPRDQAKPDAAYTYADCEDAWAAGKGNIKESSDLYHDDLDSDQDGIGCEIDVASGIKVEGRERAAAEEIAAIKASAAKEAEPTKEAEEKQVTKVPVGAADTGIAPESDPAAALAVGALGLAAVVGAGVATRRRAQA